MSGAHGKRLEKGSSRRNPIAFLKPEAYKGHTEGTHFPKIGNELAPALSIKSC
jgi:hypothetical protein